jgi:hypothetical protein
MAIAAKKMEKRMHFKLGFKPGRTPKEVQEAEARVILNTLDLPPNHVEFTGRQGKPNISRIVWAAIKGTEEYAFIAIKKLTEIAEKNSSPEISSFAIIKLFKAVSKKEKLKARALMAAEQTLLKLREENKARFEEVWVRMQKYLDAKEKEYFERAFKAEDVLKK